MIIIVMFVNFVCITDNFIKIMNIKKKTKEKASYLKGLNNLKYNFFYDIRLLYDTWLLSTCAECWK